MKSLYALSFSIYIVVSIFTFLIYGALPAILAKHGVSPQSIGMLYIAFLPFTLSFFYSGFVETYRKKYKNGFHTLNVVGILGIVALLFLISVFNPHSYFWLCIGAYFLMSFLSANIMITLNAIAVEQTTSKQKPTINTIMLISCGIGGVIGIVVALIVFDLWGFGVMNIVLAVSTLIFGLPALFIKIRQADSKNNVNSVWRAICNANLWKQLIIMLSFIMPLVLTSSMSSALFVYMGFNISAIGFLVGFLQVIALVCAAPIAYVIIKFLGFKNAFVSCLCSESLVLIILSANMWLWQNHLLIVLMLFLNSLFFGAQYVFIYTIAMRWCEGSTQSGVDFSFLRTSENIGFILAGIIASQIIGFFISEDKLNSLNEANNTESINLDSNSFGWIDSVFTTLENILHKSGLDGAIANGYGCVFILASLIAIISVFVTIGHRNI